MVLSSDNSRTDTHVHVTLQYDVVLAAVGILAVGSRCFAQRHVQGILLQDGTV